MKRVALLAIVCVLSLICASAYGQQVDATFGLNSVTPISGIDHNSGRSAVSIGGGLTPSFSADVLLRHHFGVGTEFSWSGGRKNYGGGSTLQFRPIFYDFNAIWAPTVTKNLSPEFMAGIGAENVRYYVAPSCGPGCQNFVTTNHFLGHFGAGIRYYVRGNFFIRPELHVYLVRQNLQFDSDRATRYGASLGYTFGGRR